MTQLTATILSQLKCVESPLARINYIITSKATLELFRQSSLSLPLEELLYYWPSSELENKTFLQIRILESVVKARLEVNHYTEVPNIRPFCSHQLTRPLTSFLAWKICQKSYNDNEI